MKGKKVTAAEPLPDDEDSKVLDLMSRLQASLEEGEGRVGRKEARRENARPDRRASGAGPEEDSVAITAAAEADEWRHENRPRAALANGRP